MPSRLTFDVFGKRMLVEGSPGNWRLFALGPEGKRAPVEVAIPAFIREAELEQYLGDIFHETASPRHPTVRRLP